MLNEDEPAEELRGLELSTGYRMTREDIAGFRGYRLQRLDDPAGAQYIAAPRVRRPGKKQTCTAYAYEDIRAFDYACMYLVHGDYRRAAELAEKIRAASLKNELAEGLERLAIEQGHAATFDEMHGAAVDELEQVRALLGDPLGLEVSQARPGACIWISGDTRPHAEELRALGFRWSPKRGAWYWKTRAA